MSLSKMALDHFNRVLGAMCYVMGLRDLELPQPAAAQTRFRSDSSWK